VGRTVIVGDVHGCRAELEALLSRVAFVPGDRLVMVGDLIVRGPDPAGTLDLLARLGALSVRGNHDERILRCQRGKATAGPPQIETLRRLRADHFAQIAALPLWLDLPDHGIRVVHGGVVPGVPIERQQAWALLHMRGIDAAGDPVDHRQGTLWGAVYRGPPHVVFGHNAVDGLQIHAAATGLDTGCVYGGRLTALVLPAGASVPRASDRGDAIISVQARRSA
jgi:hypothetical protein